MPYLFLPVLKMEIIYCLMEFNNFIVKNKCNNNNKIIIRKTLNSLEIMLKSTILEWLK